MKVRKSKKKVEVESNSRGVSKKKSKKKLLRKLRRIEKNRVKTNLENSVVKASIHESLNEICQRQNITKRKKTSKKAKRKVKLPPEVMVFIDIIDSDDEFIEGSSNLNQNSHTDIISLSDDDDYRDALLDINDSIAPKRSIKIRNKLPHKICSKDSAPKPPISLDEDSIDVYRDTLLDKMDFNNHSKKSSNSTNDFNTSFEELRKQGERILLESSDEIEATQINDSESCTDSKATTNLGVNTQANSFSSVEHYRSTDFNDSYRRRQRKQRSQTRRSNVSKHDFETILSLRIPCVSFKESFQPLFNRIAIFI